MTSTLERQRQKYTDAKGTPVGDCWRTALACLCLVERDSVPHFAELYPSDSSLEWWYQSIAWIEKTLPGRTLKCYEVSFPFFVDSAGKRVVVLASGKSPRGDWQHCVLLDGNTGELLHDPHPSDAGLETVSSLYWVPRKD